MITTNNYFSEVERIGINKLPETLRKSHELVLKSTNNGDSWDTYNSNETIRKVINLYLTKLNEFVSSQKGDNAQPKPEKKYLKPYPQTQQREVRHPKKAVGNKKSKKLNEERKPGKRVEHIREEIKFIKRYVGLHNKVKSPNAILSFLKALQRSIVQKLIRKTSPLSKEIEMIQDKLVNAYNKMKSDERFEINERDLGKLVTLAGGEEVYSSIKFIKRFIGMQEKELTANQVESFLKQLEIAVSKKKIIRDDPYADKLNVIYKKLKTTSGKISLTKAELNGLEGVVKACGCKESLGKIYYTKGKQLRQCKKRTYSDSTRGACSHNHGLSGVLTAEEMANRTFDMLNFNSMYASLIGRPAKNFTMMLHGEPGAGKTTFLLKFAKYLAENFGKVLYVSSEEFAASTMTEKVNELLNPFPANLFFSENFKEANISDYEFVILDSVNDLGLKLQDYKDLRKAHPETAFILILQHTKDGNYRGGKDWEHEIEIAGEVQSGSITIYRNRYGVKGTMNFFNQLPNASPALKSYTVNNSTI